MSISSLLFWGALASFFGHFSLFQKHIGTLAPDQKEIFLTRSLPGRWANLLTILPLVALLIFKDPLFRVSAALAMLVIVGVSTIVHHRSLRKLGFSVEFITKLRRLSYIGDVSIIMFIGSMLC